MSLENATCLRKKPPTPIDNTETQLNGKHFIKRFECLPNSKRKAPGRRCRVCNFTREQLAHYGYERLTLPVKYSSYGCTICTNVTLCLTPCFEVFHSEINYRKKVLTTDSMISCKQLYYLLYWLCKIRNRNTPKSTKIL